MKAILSFTLVLIVFSTLVIPTSTYASTYSTQSNSSSGFSQTFSLSYLLTIFNNDSYKNNYQYYSLEKNNYDNRYEDDWWESFLKWCNGEGSGGGGDHDDECQDNKGSWGNDDGCLDSAEIWKRWYCN
ncbi:hypothetical protein M3226_04395 [Neobacillus cucumis]|uniref:hypothetical protein n=1 Tax=Neobacillus cucumis TaxID=1740721 RepID=UPI0020423BFD|nr:hypothetical protein [Neobacillus cucumis]MCM3724938.1 hypothetical protein [Neobacillus cucumis]